MIRTLVLSTLLAALGSAQPLSYTLLGSGSPAPSPRFDGTIAYDPGGRQIYLFGGSDGAARNDLWVYSLAQRRWSEVDVASGARPPARFGHTLLLDPVRRQLVVFGGQAAGFFSDTWAFDLEARSWTQLAANDAGPSRRYGHSGIYDAARDQMVVSHGFTDAGRFDDTWAFQFATNSWRNISPATGRPLRRCLHHAEYDAAGSQMLLFGGCASGFGPCPLGDLWSFDLTTNRWTEITGSTKPAPRQHYGLGFDSVRRRLILFGGSGGGALNDTWEFDPAARAWRQPEFTGAAPSARSRHQGASAADRGTVFFFGGSTATGLSNELWMLGPGFAGAGPRLSREGVVNAFSGAGGAVAPGEIVSIYGAGLGPLDGVTLAFDSLSGRLPVSGPGVTVRFSGIAAPLYYLQAGQLNVQVPYEVAAGSDSDMVVTVNGVASAPVTLPVSATMPGLFPSGFHGDGSVVTAVNPVPAGGVVIFYVTGQGVTNPPSPSGAYPTNGFPEPVAAVALTVGGQPAEILFRGQAPGTAGVMQINTRLSPATPPGEALVALTVGEAASQSGVSIAVGP